MAVVDYGLRGRVETRMHKLGMKQKDLIEKSGLKQSAVSHVLTKRTMMPDVMTLLALADALECDARWLATGEE